MRIDGVPQVPVNTSTSNSAQGTPTNNAKNEGENVEQQIHGQKSQFNEKELIVGSEKANEKLEVYDKRLEFSIHEGTKQIMVKIVDTKNDEIIKEIPPEKILDMVAYFMELAGIIVDEKA